MNTSIVLNKKIQKLVALCFFSLVLISPVSTQGQTINLPDEASLPSQIPELKEQISINIDPQVPKPFDTVTITVEAYGTDLNRAPITWSINGKQSLKGIGEKTFNFQVGDVGSTNTIKLHIEPIGGGPAIDRTFSFVPAEVDILWEASTYTPPFYKGKALFTPEAELSFVAIPNILNKGSRVTSNNAVYKWKLDYRADASKSGFGKNVFKHTGSIILKDVLVQAESYSPTNPNAKAVGTVTVSNSDPLALFYEDHPLYGILFNRALTNQYYLTQTEVKVAAFPFNFSTPAKSSAVTYKWNLNDSPIYAPQNETLMTFRKSNNESGQASVSLVMENPNKILQSASNQFSIIFGNESTFGR